MIESLDMAWWIQSYAPKDPEHALLQNHEGSASFSNVEEAILLEGALAFWIGLEAQ